MKSMQNKTFFKVLIMLLILSVVTGCSGIDPSYKDLKSPCGTKAGKRKPLRNPE